MPNPIRMGTSTTAPSMCILDILSFVAIGIGGVGARSGRNKDKTRTMVHIQTNNRAGRRAVLATSKKTRLAPIENMRLKMTTSVTGRGLTSGGGYWSRAMNGTPKKFLRIM